MHRLPCPHVLPEPEDEGQQDARRRQVESADRPRPVNVRAEHMLPPLGFRVKAGLGTREARCLLLAKRPVLARSAGDWSGAPARAVVGSSLRVVPPLGGARLAPRPIGTPAWVRARRSRPPALPASGVVPPPVLGARRRAAWVAAARARRTCVRRARGEHAACRAGLAAARAARAGAGGGGQGSQRRRRRAVGGPHGALGRRDGRAERRGVLLEQGDGADDRGGRGAAVRRRVRAGAGTAASRGTGILRRHDGAVRGARRWHGRGDDWRAGNLWVSNTV